MAGPVLSRKPLVEAIFELHWKLSPSGGPAATPPSPEVLADPNYKLALGRFAGHLESRLPHHEQLPAASVPDEMVANIVQHRFRSGPDGWPLAQIGPGVLSFNETAAYDWQPFAEGVKATVRDWRRSYPGSAPPQVVKTYLKYIDAVPFEYASESVFAFLRKLKIDVQFTSDILTPSGIRGTPAALLWRAAFPSADPVGKLSLQVATATKDDVPAVAWETTFESADDAAPRDDESLAAWLEAAHKVTSAVFFRMIEGELYNEFI
ncbi:MAG: TIGR04255 family protein [Xanthomonadales bacterium]|nr:TIGR04255 family protein [Xanthomonadales bacterium]